MFMITEGKKISLKSHEGEHRCGLWKVYCLGTIEFNFGWMGPKESSC